MEMNDTETQQQQCTPIHDIGCIRKGILDARGDFARLYDFYAGNCDAERFTSFLATGSYYTSQLTRAAWSRTIFKEIDRIEASFTYQ